MIMVREELTSVAIVRGLWSKIAKFVFLPLVITKHLTPLMNSFCWIMGVGNGKQEIARCRDRLLLSGSWLLSHSNISEAQARREMTEYNGFLCTFSSVLDSGPDTSSARRWQTSMDVCEKMKALLICTLANDMRAHTRDFPQGSIFFLSFFLSSEEENQLNLEPLTFTLKDSN